jgi:5,10-methylenetetrahydromethanopterin reductase
VNPYSSTLPEIAMAAATLDSISAGRCVLGIGPGAKFMLQDGGVEQSNVIDTLGRAVAYLKDALGPESGILHIPVTRQIPIYIGCQSPKLLEHVGKWQVGALPLLTPPSYASKAIDAIRKGQEEAGGGFKGDDLVASFLVSLSKDEQASLKGFAAFIMPTLRHLSQHQLKEAGVSKKEIPSLQKSYSERGWEGLPQKVLRLGVTDVESCIKNIEEARDLGYGRVKCGSPLGPGKEEAMRIIVEEVFPHIGN